MKAKNNDDALEHRSSDVYCSSRKEIFQDYFIVNSNVPRLSEEMLVLREKINDELNDIERRIYELETLYWEQTTDVGNMLRGWDGYSTGNSILFTPGGRRPTVNVNRVSFKPGSNIFSERERWFSLSSVTSPVDEESLGVLSGTGAVAGETSSIAGSNVGSVVSNNSDSQIIEAEADNSTVVSRKPRK